MTSFTKSLHQIIQNKTDFLLRLDDFLNYI